MKVLLKFKRIIPYTVITLLLLIMNFAVDQTQINLQANMGDIQLLGAICILLIVFLGVFLHCKKILTPEIMIWLLIYMGFIMRLTYIMYTNSEMRQTDVWGSECGHAGYMKFILEKGTLPDSNQYQFYQPPLWHFCAAMWMKFNALFGMTIERCFENVQILSCLCSSFIMIVSYRLFEEMGLKKKTICYLIAVVAFLPIFYVMAGSINNDVLMNLLLFTSVLYFVRWYKSQRIGFLVVAALSLGLAGMTKISAVLIGLVYGVFFLVNLYKRRRQAIKQLASYFLFGLLSVPLAIWYPIRNFLKFDQLLNYIFRISESHPMFIGDEPILKRFFTFPINQFELSTLHMDACTAYNIWAYLFKSSTLMEMGFKANEGLTAAIYVLALILGLIAFCSMLYVLIKKKSCDLKFMMAAIWIVYMASFIYFNITYPFGCTMDVRYVTLLVLVSLVFLGWAMEVIKEKVQRMGRSIGKALLSVGINITRISIVSFSLISIILYLTFKNG